MNIINVKTIDKKDYFWYEDPLTWQIVIGVRGGSEYRVGIWDFEKAQDKFRKTHQRAWTEEEALKHCIKLGIIKSQYIEFEEIKPEIKYLT